MYKVSFVISTYNRAEWLKECLERVANVDFDKSRYELVLINNNSKDHTEEVVEEFRSKYPELNFSYEVEYNQGLSYSRNHGVRLATGEIFIFIDDDAFVQPEFVKNVVAGFEANPRALAYGGKVTPVFETEKPPSWYCRHNMTWVSAFDLGKKYVPFKLGSYPIGANMGILKKVFDEIGDFDVELGRKGNNTDGGEEKDFFDRMSKMDGDIIYFHDVHVDHVIPERRTTIEFIKKLGRGVGFSEKVRLKNAGAAKWVKKWLTELFKWGATFLLIPYYTLLGKPMAGISLLIFRYYVNIGLVKGRVGE